CQGRIDNQPDSSGHFLDDQPQPCVIQHPPELTDRFTGAYSLPFEQRGDLLVGDRSACCQQCCAQKFGGPVARLVHSCQFTAFLPQSRVQRRMITCTVPLRSSTITSSARLGGAGLVSCRRAC